MTPLAWLTHQLYLTYHQILVDITIPHIITGGIFYMIVHRTTKITSEKAHRLEERAHQLEHDTEKVFKSHAQKIINTHVWNRHGGHPLLCEHPECAVELAVMTDPTPR